MPANVFAVVLAFKKAPTTFKWSDGGSGNFMGSVTADTLYKDENGAVVDHAQKPMELYSCLIDAITSEEQWIMDLCCGTGKLIYKQEIVLLWRKVKSKTDMTI